jgi:30S ribosomal protein S31
MLCVLIYFSIFTLKLIEIMGKGDKKTKRGKRHIGTHGVSRPKLKKSAAKKPATKAKAPAKKKAAKKSAKKAS